MKLYATTISERASRPARKGSNSHLRIDISVGNKPVGYIMVNHYSSANTTQITYHKPGGEPWQTIDNIKE